MDVYGARDLVGGDLPSVKHTLHHLSTTLDWQVRDNLLVSATHGYFRYRDNNFAWDLLSPGDLNNVLINGQQNPNEVINFFSIAISYALDSH